MPSHDVDIMTDNDETYILEVHQIQIKDPADYLVNLVDPDLRQDPVNTGRIYITMT